MTTTSTVPPPTLYQYPPGLHFVVFAAGEALAHQAISAISSRIMLLNSLACVWYGTWCAPPDEERQSAAGISLSYHNDLPHNDSDYSGLL